MRRARPLWVVCPRLIPRPDTCSIHPTQRSQSLGFGDSRCDLIPALKVVWSYRLIEDPSKGVRRGPTFNVCYPCIRPMLGNSLTLAVTYRGGIIGSTYFLAEQTDPTKSKLKAP